MFTLSFSTVRFAFAALHAGRTRIAASTWISVGVCIALFLCAMPSAQGQSTDDSFFERVPVMRFSETEQRAYNRIAAQATTASVQMVQVRANHLVEQPRVHLNVSDTSVLHIARERIERRSAADYSWIGALGDPANHAHFVVRSGRVTGSIRVEGRLYQLRPLSGTGHVLIEVDETAFPPTDPEELEGGVLKHTEDAADRISELEDEGAAPATGDLPVIDIIVAYTSDAVHQLVDVQAAIQLAIDETNITYENSNIQARVRLALAYETPTRLQESYNDLQRFLTPGDGYFDEVHGLRSAYGADVAMLVGGRSQDFEFCGVANLIYAEAPNEAFALTATDCLNGVLTFGHEVGHLQGARHNPEEDPSNTPFAYGHGTTDPENGFRTVMAYNDRDRCPDGICTRVPFWSSPDVTYEGITTGDAAERHNTRVLDTTAPFIAAFQPPQGTAPTFDVTPPALEANASEQIATTITNTSSDAVLNWSISRKQEGEVPAGESQDPLAYVWQDSRDAGGPPFAWRDISTTGTSLSFTGDAHAEIALPFNFSFYDETHDTAYVSPNGALTFTPEMPLPPFNLPVVAGNQRSMLAPFWDAIDLGAGGAVYAGMSDTEWFVVQWENVRRVDGDGPYTFQVLLHPDGSVRFQYKEMAGSVTSTTVGIADDSGTGGVQVTHNSAYLEDNLAIDFAAGAQWLQVAPQTGTLFPGEQQDLAVGFTLHEGLPLGTYRGTIRVMAQNASTESITVPVTLEFRGARIGGIAFRDENRNGARDAPESILNGIEVELIEDTNANGQRDPGEPVVGTQTTSQSGTRTTRQPGEYLFIGVDPGTYLVRYAANRASARILKPTTGPAESVTVAENEHVTDVRIGLAPPGRLYVDEDAAPGGDGLSWQTALRDLDVALRGANGETEVWIAEGVYTPPDAETSFRITSAQDGMQVYGGFQGTETHRDQRDPDRYPTVLSGDIDRNDQVDARGVTRTSDDWAGTNAYRVLELDGSYSSTGITPATVLDGMIITAGGRSIFTGGGIYCHANQGVCSPVLRNVDFIANRATYGAAFFIGTRAGGVSSPTITGSTFENNRTEDDGSAIGSGGLIHNCRGTLTLRDVRFTGNFSFGFGDDDTYGGALFLDDTCEADIARATFTDNRTTGGGGAIYAQGSGALTLTGVTFADNYTEGAGGALRVAGARTMALTNVAFLGNRSDALGGAIYTGGTSDVTIDIVGATFTGNASNFGGALYNDGRSSGAKAVSFANTILWDNQGNGSDIWNAGDGATIVVDHVVVRESGIVNEGSARVIGPGPVVAADPQFVDAAGPDNVVGTLDDNVRVAATSPARDAGNGNAIPDGIATDLAGNPRIQDDDGDGAARVDIGAYEGNLARAIPNQAIALNGVSTYVRADGVADALADAAAFTVEAWVHPTQADGQQGLATFHDATGGNRNLLLYRDGRFQYYDGPTGYKSSRNAFPPGKWYHVALTVDASDAATLYVNGRREATFITDVRPEAGGRFSMGQEWDGNAPGDFFAGHLDEVRVWRAARTQAAIQDGMSLSLGEENTLGDAVDLASLVAYYRFEGNEADHTGLYAGRITGTASYTHDVDRATATDALVVRVHAAASNAGSRNGTSWDDAHATLHTALQGTGPRNELWVAAGTYTPVTPDNPGNVTSADREASFRVTGDQDGVHIYGGFAGGETERAQRRVVANPTVLSGDIGNAGDTSDNSYHVFVFDGGNAIGDNVAANITTETVLDGVTITAGNANGSYPHGSGGGLYCDGSGTNETGARNACSPTLRDVQFVGNAARFGGAIYSVASGGGASAMQIARAAFLENEALESGGAIYFAGDNGSIAARVVSSVFANNTASHVGFDDGQAGEQPQFIHSTFTGASEQAIDVSHYDTGRTPLQAVNSVFWDNGPGGIAGSSGAVSDPDAAVAVRYSIVEEARYTAGSEGASNIWTDPRFVDAEAPIGPDGLLGTADDGLRLHPMSPAIARGTDAPLSPADNAEPIATDFGGQARQFGLFPDPGAYELQAVASTSRTITEATGLAGYVTPRGFGGMLLLRDAVYGDLVFTRTEVRPESPDLPAGVAPVTWTVDAALRTAPTYDLMLDVSSLPGIGAFDQLVLYTSRDGGATWDRVTDRGGTLVLREDRQLVAVQDMTGFSQFAVASSDPGNPLPVELAALEAQPAGPDAVTVQWQTLSEQDNARFEVQRQVRAGARANMHGAAWETVAQRNGAGTTDVPQRYRIEDTSLPYAADSLAYRLRQVNTDGTAAFSREVTIARPVPGAELLPTYPNPTRGQATVRFAVPTRQAVRITLYDLLGRRIRTLVDADREGRYEHTLDVTGLASGTYFLRMRTESGVVDTQRITVVR